MAILRHIVEQHADDLASLWDMRTRVATAAHFSLRDLLQLDNRIDANVDGLALAGEEGWAICRENLRLTSAGDVFAHAVVAIRGERNDRIFELLGAVEGDARAWRGLVSALGWVSFSIAERHILSLLESADAGALRTGLMAAVMHRRDPGEPLLRALENPDPVIRAAALRATGKLGMTSLGAKLRWHLGDDDPACRLWAAVTLSLFAFDPNALGVLITQIESNGDFSDRAAQLVGRRLSTAQTSRWVQSLGTTPERKRAAVVAAGARGAPELVPWLIDQMGVAATARVAGEAFALMTGTDLKRDGLSAEKTEGFTTGPTDNPEDEEVDMDPDEYLVWPAATEIRTMWERNEGRFARGTRYLLGAPITPAHCETILRGGRQPHRAAAATELVLKNAGALFPIGAPAFRQLAIMGVGPDRG